MKKTRKIAIMLMICVLCVSFGSFFASGVAAKNTVEGQFSFEIFVESEDQIDIGIKLTSDSDVTNGSFNFYYDREALEFICENEKSAFVKNALVQANNDYEDANGVKTLRVSFASAYPLPEGTGVIFSGKFKVIKTGAAELAIKNGKLYLHNDKFDKYLPDDFTAQVFLDKYTEDLAPTASCTYSIDEQYIKLVKPGTKVKEIKNSFMNTNIKVCGLNGEEKEDDDTVGTGFSVCLLTTNGECSTGVQYATVVIRAHKIVVSGDSDGNGKVDSTDTILMKRHMLNIALLSDASFEAMDFDGNAKIDSTDYIYLKRILLGLIK